MCRSRTEVIGQIKNPVINEFQYDIPAFLVIGQPAWSRNFEPSQARLLVPDPQRISQTILKKPGSDFIVEIRGNKYKPAVLGRIGVSASKWPGHLLPSGRLSTIRALVDCGNRVGSEQSEPDHDSSDSGFDGPFSEHRFGYRFTDDPSEAQ